MLEGTYWFPIILLLIGVAVAALIVVIIIKCVRGMRRLQQTESCPVEQVFATVLEKQVTERERRTLSREDFSAFGTETVCQYRIVFQMEDGTERCMEVPETVYALLAEGDIGTLTMQGERFLQFERNR